MQVLHDHNEAAAPRATAAHPFIQRQPLRLVTAACALALLAACGGGGGGSATPVVDPPAVVTTRISGVAATGAALAGASVQVKCAVGSASGTTASNGSFTLNLSNATQPCVLSALSADGSIRLHSMTDPAGGTTQTVQINPVTELMVARVAGGSAASFFSSFDAAAQAKLTASAFTGAATAVVQVLRDGGIDLSAIGNPVTATLVPATGGTAGNAYDQALDVLAARLSGGQTTLAQLATQVVAAAATTGTTDTAVTNAGFTASASAATSLPLAALLRPAHADCAALRSGAYDLVVPSDSANLVRRVQIDAPTATLTFPDGSTSTATSTGGCSFQIAADKVRWVVSPAGVIVAISGGDASAPPRLSLAVPVQAATLADLAGDWNWASFFEVNDPATGLRAVDMGTARLNGSGQVTALANCPQLAACTDQTNQAPAITLHPAGGFTATNGGGTTRGLFYRPANGDPMVVWVSATDLMVFSRPRALALPTVGDTWHRLIATVSPQLQATNGFSFTSYSAVEVDATARTFTRRTLQDGGRQLFRLDQPRTGMAYRVAGSSVLDNGTTQTVSENYLLPLGGTGVIAFGRQTTETTRNQGNFGFVVDVPAAGSGGAGAVR